MYAVLLLLHILGVAMWLGSGLTYLLWSRRGRGVANLDVTSFVFRTIARSSATITVPGALLTVLSGVGLTFIGGFRVFDPSTPWLSAMQVFGLVALALSLTLLHPMTLRLAQLAEQGVRRGHQDPEFYAVNRQQAIVSSVSGMLIVAAIVVVYVLR